MYIRRKVDTYLQKWKEDSNHKPLIIKGARQTGKPESIRHFAGKNYKSFIEINFVEQPKYKAIIEDGYDAAAIIKIISRINPALQFIEQDTLILFDEVQEFPEIATSLKFFSQDGRFDVICSGSLLGIQYKRIESNSVGYKTDYIMHSLDFEEFLWAKGYGNDVIEEMYQHMVNGTPFNSAEMKVFTDLFLDYCILGGLPAVVKQYLISDIFEGTLDIQHQIINDYKEDIRKYADGMDQTRILNVFEQIPIQLSKENKKFQISKVASGARFKDYRGCIEWLRDAGLVNICYCLNQAELPLKGNYNPEKYKLYYFDTGMLVSMLDEEAQEDLRANKNLNVYKGALYENIVAEALVKSDFGLYYYKKDNSTLEEDFFIRTANYLVPVEVKATNGKSKSLSTLIKSDSYEDIRYGIKLALANVGKENNIITFPYFCTFLLKRYMKEHGEDVF